MLTEENCVPTPEEISFIKTRKKSKQLAFALFFKCYQLTHSFDHDLSLVSEQITHKLAEVLGVLPQINKLPSKTYRTFRALIRAYLQTSSSKKKHYAKLTEWIKNELLPGKHIGNEALRAASILYLKEMGVDSFKEKSLMRAINNAMNSYENELFAVLRNSLLPHQEAKLNALLLPYKEGLSYLGWINKDFTNPALDSMLCLADQLYVINEVEINLSVIEAIPRKRILYYTDSFTRFSPSHIKEMTDDKRCAYLLLHNYVRRQQIIDRIIDMFNYLTRNIIQKAERRVVQKLINDVKKVSGKETILFNIAESCLSAPDKTIREQIFPTIGRLWCINAK